MPPDPAPAGASAMLQARLHAIVLEADGIASFELRAADGGELPAFSAGAHIDVHLRPGCVRQYSLCNDPRERHRYVVAVQREEAGRGGSRAMHDELRIGQALAISAPRNFFPLASEARRHLLLGGGIGITPMMAMVAELEARGAEFFLHSCTRGPGKTAFRGRLEALAAAGRGTVHHDGGVPSQGLDVRALLRDHDPGTHLYYCGPPGFMGACERASTHWPSGTVHCEHFAASSSPKSFLSNDELEAAGDAALSGLGFQIKVASSGAVYIVPNDKSIVEVLGEHGIEILTSCKAGLCATCKIRYLSGEVEHRDMVLDEAEQSEYLTACVSRAKSSMLVLDL